jgi:hypothetical protein
MIQNKLMRCPIQLRHVCCSQMRMPGSAILL